VGSTVSPERLPLVAEVFASGVAVPEKRCGESGHSWQLPRSRNIGGLPRCGMAVRWVAAADAAPKQKLAARAYVGPPGKPPTGSAPRICST